MSKPPSSDIVKPKAAGQKTDGGEKIGGQKGHKKQDYKPFPQKPLHSLRIRCQPDT
ncbi:MAG: DUF6444 domain-containing protein [Treponema sp.]|nr:DUF6444 domain-containing protein [Treponema sp.]